MKNGRVAVIVVAAAAFLRLVLLAHRYAVNILVMDQWDFYQPYFAHLGLVDIFRWQHGAQLQGLGCILQKVDIDWIAWRDPAVALAIVIVLALAMASALALKRSILGPLSPTDIVIPLVFLTSNQYETIILAPNMAPAAVPLLLIVLICGAWCIPDIKGRCGAVVVCNYLLLFTGFGFVMGAVTPMLLALFAERRWREGARRDTSWLLLSVLVCVLSLGHFLSDYRFSPSVDCFVFPHQPVWEYFLFMGLMLAKFCGLSYLMFPAAATAAAVVLLGAGLWVVVIHVLRVLHTRTTDVRPSLVILALVGFTLCFAAATGVGRICLGLHASGSTRYMTLAIPFFLGVYLHLLTVARRWPLAPFLLALLVLPGYMPPSFTSRASLRELVEANRAWRSCYLAGGTFAECDRQSGRPLHPNYSAARVAEKMEYLRAHRLNLFAPE